jgi:hypothetical protein
VIDAVSRSGEISQKQSIRKFRYCHEIAELPGIEHRKPSEFKSLLEIKEYHLPIGRDHFQTASAIHNRDIGRLIGRADMGKTLYDKLWDSHVIHVEAAGTTLLYVDRQLLHEVTSPQAFEGLRQTGRRV